MKKIILWVLTFCFASSAYAQLTIQDGTTVTPSDVVTKLVGNGVNVQNLKVMVAGSDAALLTGTDAINAKKMYGTYASADATNNDGIHQQGILISSGKVLDVIGASSGFASTSMGFGGDGSISNSHDAVAIQFDIYPTAPILYFSYTFASEEYPEYVCSNFNDQFRLLVTGPNPNPTYPNYNGTDIAVIPNTPIDPANNFLGTPVSINTVNSGGAGANPPCLPSNVFFHNPNDSPYMKYDQRTKHLRAKVRVKPGQKYTLYFVVADRADGIFDTGVFIEQMNTNIPIIGGVQAQSVALQAKEVVEGMEFTTLKIERPDVSLGEAETFTVEASGTATAGTDYEIYEGNTLKTLPFTVDFGVNDLVKNYTLKIKTDSENEGNETIKFSVKNPTTQLLQSEEEYTIKGTDALFPATNTSLARCSASQVIEYEAPLADSYAWDAPVGSYTCVTGDCRKISINNSQETVNLTCKLGFGNLPASNSTISQVITVTPQVMTASDNVTICSGSSAQLQASGRTSYQWSPSTGLSCTNCANPIANPSQTTTYTVTGVSASCGNEQKTVLVTVGTSTETLSIGGLNNIYCISEPAITLVGSPAGGSFLVNGQSATSFSPVTLGAGMHTVEYRKADPNGICTNSVTKMVEVTAGAVNISNNVAPKTATETQNTAFSIAATGKISLAYQWQVNTGSGFANISNNATYSGATTNTLTINAVPLAFNTYKYRCVLTDCVTSVNSAEGTLTVQPLSIASAKLQAEIVISPNPAKDKVWFNAMDKNVTNIEILSLEGKVLAQITPKRPTAERIEVSLPALDKGTYLLKIWVGKDFAIKRLVKE